MKINYFNFKNRDHIYDYECKVCGQHFSRIPSYIDKSTSVECKHCPECGHKFTKEVNDGNK